jgi:hypothetical protein
MDLLAFYALAGVVVIIALFSQFRMEGKRSNPADKSVINSSEISQVSILEEGECSVTVYRQSGYCHGETQIFESRAKAMASAMGTLRRSKIDFVAVTRNDRDAFEFRRPYHCHRGRKEGKKVGSISIRRFS